MQKHLIKIIFWHAVKIHKSFCPLKTAVSLLLFSTMSIKKAARKAASFYERYIFYGFTTTIFCIFTPPLLISLIKYTPLANLLTSTWYLFMPSVTGIVLLNIMAPV